jgi:hypothetical protein
MFFGHMNKNTSINHRQARLLKLKIKVKDKKTHKDWDPVSESGFLDFRIFRFPIIGQFSFCSIFLTNMQPARGPQNIVF